MDYDYLKYKKILIVDDEADLREMVTSILEQDGFKTIKTAGTVAEALKICRDWEPDLAILDVMLPDGNGFSLFEQMRTFTEVPVLFLTARGEDEDKLKGLGLGADDYMVKPFLPKELSLRIGIILRRYYKGEDPIVSNLPGNGVPAAFFAKRPEHVLTWRRMAEHPARRGHLQFLRKCRLRPPPKTPAPKAAASFAPTALPA